MTLYGVIANRIGDVAIPAKPAGRVGEYTFPEDPTILSSDEVGRWMFSLTAWNGYVLRNMALSDLRAAELRNKYDQALQDALLQVEMHRGKTKNQMNLEALSLNPELASLKTELDAAVAETQVWERLHKIYETQVAVLSRELSRRAMEQATEQKIPF